MTYGQRQHLPVLFCNRSKQTKIGENEKFPPHHALASSAHPQHRQASVEI